MSKARMTNLDIRCAKLGHGIAQISGMDEKTINATLAVLEEQGPYAMFLYLQVQARHSNVASEVNDKALEFLQSIFRGQLNDKTDILEAMKKLAEDVDTLLFARDLLRNALAYARYHLKAKEGSK